jgi:hypothetical protein
MVGSFGQRRHRGGVLGAAGRLRGIVRAAWFGSEGKNADFALRDRTAQRSSDAASCSSSPSANVNPRWTA